MGSPLAPVLAKIFMGFHESKWLNEYNLNKPKFCLKYIENKKRINQKALILCIAILFIWL